MEDEIKISEFLKERAISFDYKYFDGEVNKLDGNIFGLTDLNELVTLSQEDIDDEDRNLLNTNLFRSKDVVLHYGNYSAEKFNEFLQPWKQFYFIDVMKLYAEYNGNYSQYHGNYKFVSLAEAFEHTIRKIAIQNKSTRIDVFKNMGIDEDYNIEKLEVRSVCITTVAYYLSIVRPDLYLRDKETRAIFEGFRIKKNIISLLMDDDTEGTNGRKRL